MSTPARAWRSSVGAIAIAGVVVALAPPSDAVVMPAGPWLVFDPVLVAQCTDEADPDVRATLGCDAVLEPRPEQEAEPAVATEADAGAGSGATPGGAAAPEPVRNAGAPAKGSAASGGGSPSGETTRTPQPQPQPQAPPDAEIEAAGAAAAPDVLVLTGAEEPPAETAVIADPAVEVPETEVPGLQDPGAEEPVTDEPAAEDPASEPAAEDPAAEEPAAGGPGPEGPAAQEPAAGQLVDDPAIEPTGGDSSVVVTEPAVSAVPDDSPVPSSGLAGDLLAGPPPPPAEPEPEASTGTDSPVPSTGLAADLLAGPPPPPVEPEPEVPIGTDSPVPSTGLAGDLPAAPPPPPAAPDPEPGPPGSDDGPTPSSDLGRDLVGAPTPAEPQPLVEVPAAPPAPQEPPPASGALGADLAPPPEANDPAGPERAPDESAAPAVPLPGDLPPEPEPEPAPEPEPDPEPAPDPAVVPLPTQPAGEGAEADPPPGQAQGVLPDVPADPATAGEQQMSEETVPDPADDPADATVAPPASAPAPLPVTGIVTAGVPIDVVLDTIRTLESDGRYEIGPNRSGASGAYQYIVKTWNGYAGYPEAYLAPPAVQDQRAREDVQRVLATYGGDVTAVPLWWYYPISLRDASWLDRVPNPAHNTLTVREYQTRWLTIYNQKLAAYAPSPAVPSSAPDTVRTIAFPVLGPTSYWNDWGACRDGCSRRHQGNDLLGVRMQPLLAAVDGTVTRIRYENVGKAGSVVTVTGADGWYYNYFHVNNDTPGSDDGWAGPEWQASPYLQVGMSVRAGQIIGYMGDSGNAEGSVPHLHFEIRSPDGVAVNPYPSLIAARARQQCSIGLGPWSTMVDPAASAAPAVSIAPLFGTGAWNIDAVGRVTATGDAALIYSKSPEGCPPGPATPFGTGAEGGGLPGGLLPLGAELALGAPVEQAGRGVVELPTADGSSVRMLVEPAGTATPGSNGRPPTW